MNIEKFEPHQKRVVEEVNALDDNRAKLSIFVNSKAFAAVEDPEERALMVEQLLAMNKLSDILHARIEIFRKRAEAAA